MSHHEVVYLQRDNSIKLGLTADGAPVDSRVLTRVVMTLTDDDGNVTTFDSANPNQTAVFDFTTELGQVSDVQTGILIIKLQNASPQPAPGNDYTANLILYDTQNPNGIYWDDPFPLRVVDG